MIAALVGVLLVGTLLGVEIWGVGTWLLARVVAALRITPGLLAAVGGAFLLSVLAWVVAVMGIALGVQIVAR